MPVTLCGSLGFLHVFVLVLKRRNTGWDVSLVGHLAGRWESYLYWQEVQIVLMHRSNTTEWESELELEQAVLDAQPSGKLFPHACSSFWPRGSVPACRATCALNCQGVVMPWWGHFGLSLLYYQTKKYRSSQEWTANVRRLPVMDSSLSDFDLFGLRKDI